MAGEDVLELGSVDIDAESCIYWKLVNWKLKKDDSHGVCTVS